LHLESISAAILTVPRNERSIYMLATFPMLQKVLI